jgi:hypothetical protein
MARRHQSDDNLLTPDETYRLEALKKRKDEVIERIKVSSSFLIVNFNF